MNDTTRRDFLRSALMLTGSIVLPSSVFAQDTAKPKKPKNPYAPFKMGVQTYSLRGYKAEEAMKRTKELGLTYWEGWDGHLPMTDDPKKLAEYQEMLKTYGIMMPTYGVVYFNNDEKAVRRIFEFAKAMNISTLSASPSSDSFPLVDKMVKEYAVNIAIHNHGPDDKMYGKPEQIIDAVKMWSPRIGACNDTGHYLRFEVDPVKASALFDARLFGVHLKNAKKNADGSIGFTEIGAPGGLLQTAELFTTLRRIKYRGIVSLEYEEHEDNPIPFMAQCLEATRLVIADMKKTKA